MSAAPRCRAVVVPDQDILERLGAAPEGFRHVLWEQVESGEVGVEEVGFAVIDRRGGTPRRELMARLANADAIQAMSVGVDYLDGWYPPGAAVCNAAPAISEQTAEHALALALALLRRIPDYVRLQDGGVWDFLDNPAPAVPRRGLGTLWGANAAVLGFGTVGASIARRLQAFGASVTAYARSAREVDGVVVRPLAEVAETIGRADVVISALPLTAETAGALDAAFFASLAPDAVFVNVGRGRSVVQAALVEAVASGRIRAGLDVAAPEPLPSDDPLFRTPGVLLTPHVGGDNRDIVATLNGFVAAQALAWERGDALVAVIREPMAGARA